MFKILEANQIAKFLEQLQHLKKDEDIQPDILYVDRDSGRVILDSNREKLLNSEFMG